MDSNTAGYDDKSNGDMFQMHKMGLFGKVCRALGVKTTENWNQGSSTKTVKIEDASEKAMCAIDGAGFDWSDMAEEEIQANMALMAFSDSKVKNDKSCSKNCLKNYEALKKQYDDLLVFKNWKFFFSEEIALLKRSVGCKEYELGLLRTELEKVKQEKEGVDFKIAKNSKEPEVIEYGPRDSSLKPTTGCDKESDNSKENTNDSLEQHQMTDTETSSFESPLKVENNWKEKFFYPANHIKSVN
ncbi:hypothetical protein Tco_0448678 [Tanacetum coccineum]